MSRRGNKLRNTAGLIFKLRIIVAVQDLKISFYTQILVPPPRLVSAPLHRLLWRRHCGTFKRFQHFGLSFLSIFLFFIQKITTIMI